MFIVLAFINGVFSFFNMILAAKVAKDVGMIKGIFYNFFWATVSSFIAYFILEAKTNSLFSFKVVPILYLIGGLIGIIINFIFNKAIPRVSSVYIVVIRFIGQLFLGIIIDYFYLNIFSLGKLLGLLFFGIGLTYNSYIDNKYNMKNNSFIKKIA